MAKNPFMSAYLSAANRVANTARGHATNEIKRQSNVRPPAWSTPGSMHGPPNLRPRPSQRASASAADSREFS